MKGEKLRLERAKYKLSQTDLARAVNCSRQTILNLETGKSLSSVNIENRINEFFINYKFENMDKLLVNTLFLERQRKNKTTQAELAGAVNCTRQVIIGIESGEINPPLVLAFAISDFFDKKVSEIFKLNI